MPVKLKGSRKPIVVVQEEKPKKRRRPKMTARQVAKNFSTPGMFEYGGSTLGGLAGPTGAKVGGMIGRGLSSIMGFGDYTVKTNSLGVSGCSLPQDSVPQFVTNKHATRITHREYVGDIVIPANQQSFNLTQYAINPGNGQLFPWLSSIAKNFQQYKLLGAIVEFKTMTSDYAANGPLGTVVLATNYNSNDAAFINKVQMENSEFAVSSKPSMSVVHPIECDPKEQVADILYVRDSSADTYGVVSDKRLYDWGNFQFATQGLPGVQGNVLGELWISYDIELLKPIVSPSSSVGVTWAQFKYPTTGAFATNQWSNMVDAGLPGSVKTLIDTVGLPSLTASIRLEDAVAVGAASANKFRFLRPGKYLFMTYSRFAVGSSVVLVTPPTLSVGYGGGTPQPYFGTGTTDSYADSTARASWSGAYTVEPAAVGSVLTLLNSASVAASGSESYFRVVVLEEI